MVCVTVYRAVADRGITIPAVRADVFVHAADAERQRTPGTTVPQDFQLSFETFYVTPVSICCVDKEIVDCLKAYRVTSQPGKVDPAKPVAYVLEKRHGGMSAFAPGAHAVYVCALRIAAGDCLTMAGACITAHSPNARARRAALISCSCVRLAIQCFHARPVPGQFAVPACH